MKFRTLAVSTIVASGLAIGIMALAPDSYADERYTPVKDELTKKECSACHMAFQPQMLPKQSWNKIMATLADHFGEDASLSADKTEHIRKYLVENAADAGWRAGRFLRGLERDAAPLRITETPHWIREHNKEVPPQAWNDPRVKSKANCPACHRGAEQGFYDDD